MAVERIFTKNDAIAMMHRERAYSFRQVIAFVKKHGIDIGELLELMEEIANEADAQALVVKLRDELDL